MLKRNIATEKDGFLRSSAVITPDGEQPAAPEKETNSMQSGPLGAVTVLWKAESNVPKLLQYILIFLWVAVLAVLPLVLPLYDARPLTKTEICLGASTMFVTVGGFYLFTNVVLFQSSHFDRIRPLTNVECIYFMAQVVTTIGYGDIGPAKTRGQFFVGFYCIFALFVIAMTIQNVAEHFAKIVQTYKKRFVSHEELAKTPRSETIHRLIAPTCPSPKSFLLSLAAFAIIDIIFVIFFSHFPGENKTVLEALYMSLITLGSIGFGFFTPLTETGMIFGSFSMVIGCAAMMFAIGEFGAFVYQYNEYQQFTNMEKEAHEAAGRPSEVMNTLRSVVKGSDRVTELQFLHFVLVQKSKTSSDEINDILKVFKKFEPKNGSIPLADVTKSWEDVDQWPDSIREHKAPKATSSN